MALEDIQKKIIADAEKKKEELLAVSSKQAEAIVEEGKKLAKEYIDEQAKMTLSSAENLERGLIIDARRTFANKILAHKRSKLEKVFEQAKKDFCMSQDYYTVMKSLVLRSVSSKKEKIILGQQESILDQNWLSEVNNACSGQLTFASEKGNFIGGVFLEDQDIFVNITVDTLFEVLRSSTEKPVADILFKG